MSDLSIETNQLTKSFGSFTAVNALTLKVQGTKCVGFLGPNGAGKTTTLKILTAMVRPTSGTARINGIDVHSEKRKALYPCGVLIESPEIYPALTPREALSYVCELRGIPASERTGRIKAVLEQVRMSDWIDKRTGKFSKGMKQRVNIAASLLPDPDILLPRRAHHRSRPPGHGRGPGHRARAQETTEADFHELPLARGGRRFL